MANDKRLIEDYLPIEAISKEASREKSVRKGHISTLHLWWARRPLVACRAAVYGALVPASRFVPENGPDNKKQSLGRANAAKFIERLCKYPGNPNTIAEAQRHILEAHAERLTQETGEKVTVEDIEEGRAPRPKVLDMFAGGGAIPLEALRLGCEAYALDLNPVAHIIELCTLVYPQKYGKPDPNVRGMTGPENDKGETTWGGLASEVRYWGNWVLEKVKAEIGDLYPLIPDPEAKGEEIGGESQERMEFAKGSQQRLKTQAGYLTPVAYLWTRTVRCKNPSCGATVPLVRQTWLCKKKGRYAALKMIAPKGEKNVRFEVVESDKESGLGFDPAGFSKGGNATCPFCGTVADNNYTKIEGQAKRIGQQMMAIVGIRQGKKGKTYLAADNYSEVIPDEKIIKERIDITCSETGLTIPSEPIITDAKNSCWTYLYGLDKFNELFSPRQLLCLLTFASSINDALNEMHKRGYESEYAKALSSYCGLLNSRLGDWNSTIAHWIPVGEKVADTFARQAIPMSWDFSEIYPLGNVSGNSVDALERMVEALESHPIKCISNVQRGTATELPWDSKCIDAVITDPPYYDNVPYADISDFFYVWLKRSIGHLYPEHFSTEGTPKKAEAVADAVRYGRDKKKAEKAYEQMMADSFAEANRVLKPGGQMTIVYAHKTTLGWSTLIDALRQAGFIVSEAWPLDTEKPGRLRSQESAALASSIFLIARKRESAETGSYEDDVRPELERIIRERVEALWAMGITGADLKIAAVGAGMRAFTRFAKVEYANGEEVPAERFLAEVEGVVQDMLMQKIIRASRPGASNGQLPSVSSIDPVSRFYVLWRYTYKAAEMDAGEAIVFTYGQHVELDGQHGLSAGNRALVEKKKGKYRLRDYTERGSHEKLGIADNGHAPLVDILHRVLWLMENEPRKLAEFLGQARPNREHLRLIAEALAGPGLSGKSVQETGQLITTTGSEQAALGKLLANWRSLIEASHHW